MRAKRMATTLHPPPGAFHPDHFSKKALTAGWLRKAAIEAAAPTRAPILRVLDIAPIFTNA
jgi:hypothetical protein